MLFKVATKPKPLQSLQGRVKRAPRTGPIKAKLLKQRGKEKTVREHYKFPPRTDNKTTTKGPAATTRSNDAS